MKKVSASLGIRGKLVFLFVLSLGLILSFILLTNYSTEKGAMSSVRTSEISNTFMYYLETVNAITDKMTANAMALAHAGELLYATVRTGETWGSVLPGSAALDELMDRYLVAQVGETEHIVGGGFWYEPRTIDPGRLYVGPYAFWEDGVVKMTWEYSNAAYDYRSRDWYTIAVPLAWDRKVKRDRPYYITPPYTDTLNGKKVIFITIAAPMYSQGEIIGVSTTDWSMDLIQASLSGFHITPHSFIFLIDGATKSILFHPSESELMVTADKLPWGKAIKQERLSDGKAVSMADVALEGRSYEIRYMKTDAGFIFGTFVDKDEILADFRAITLRNLFNTLALLLLTTILLFLAVDRIVIAPVNRLKKGVIAFSATREMLELPVHVNDEIGQLTSSFKEMAQKLRENVSLLSGVVNSISTALITVNDRLEILLWNMPAVMLLTLPEKNVSGKTLWDVHQVFREHRPEIEKAVTDASSASYYRMKLFGDERLFNMMLYPLHIPGLRTITGEVESSAEKHGLIIRIDDITDADKKDRQLRQAQKLETVGVLAGGIAHDFNNILGGLLGAITLLRTKLAEGRAIPDADLDEELRFMEEGATGGTDIVRQLLNVAGKRDDTVVGPVDLNTTAQYVAKIIRNTADRSVTVSVTPSPKPAIVTGSVSQIEQALLNICINGVHAMTIMKQEGVKQGGRLEITVQQIDADRYFCETHPEASEGTYFKVAVRDEGVGMDMKTVAKIFDPFFTTKEKGKGTGLGLSVVYSIVKNSGGFIDVYSEKGIGSVFSLYYPTADAAETTALDSRQAATHRGSGMVLVVDDDPIMRKVAKDILDDCGYSVITASDGNEAVEIFAEQAPSLKFVLLDMILPKRSGKELFNIFRQISPDMKIILTSGFYNPDTINELQTLGAAGFIQKPYTYARLCETLNSSV